MKTNTSPDALFAQHLAEVGRRIDAALAHAGLDALVIHAGHPGLAFQDDQYFPYRPNPWFSWLVPLRDAPDSLIVWRTGKQPLLVMVIPDDYWHLPPAPPTDPWVAHFTLSIVSSVEQTRRFVPESPQNWAWFGEPQPPAGLQENPAGLLRELQQARCRKTAYEIACLEEASRRGVAGHGAAMQAFRARHSEYGIHMAFLSASGMTDEELPYGSIVALNEHAATLHYQRRDRAAPAQAHSLLIDAGAGFRGYGSDITRSYAAREGLFGGLIEGMESLQQQLCSQVRPGASWPALHLDAHRGVAVLLRDAGVLDIDADEAVANGLTGHFLPHGLGHLLGLQVHDVGGFRPAPDADPIAPPAGHPWLRLTRPLAQDFVVTVEPGVYFIPSLLGKLRAGPVGVHVDWKLVEQLMPYGGIRIEDNVLVTDNGHRNLTREAFARDAIAAA